MNYIVRLTDQVRQAIEEQAGYIAVECCAPINAGRWLERVDAAIDSLVKWPRRCSIAQEDQYRSYEIRCLRVDSHFLLFIPDDEQQTVWIVGFRHTHMEPRPGELPDQTPIQ